MSADRVPIEPANFATSAPAEGEAFEVHMGDAPPVWVWPFFAGGFRLPVNTGGRLVLGRPPQPGDHWSWVADVSGVSPETTLPVKGKVIPRSDFRPWGESAPQRGLVPVGASTPTTAPTPQRGLVPVEAAKASTPAPTPSHEPVGGAVGLVPTGVDQTTVPPVVIVTEEALAFLVDHFLTWEEWFDLCSQARHEGEDADPAALALVAGGLLAGLPPEAPTEDARRDYLPGRYTKPRGRPPGK